jgi:hypothetical protein
MKQSCNKKEKKDKYFFKGKKLGKKKAEKHFNN